ncbi:putative transcription factor interactor and regulator CCHC(Zn) family [Helianthus annuus]|nr:putative transcription factor interactor and regulator CCHC(Zn) family [Helianthus annuus]KAJ0923144.1 putative transcription factor interactor and regulator CCHC(Zn) family [Helianthus annuus]
MNADAAKQHTSFLASILESYESLVASIIGNLEMTKEDYDQIDPEEMELIDIRWCMADVISRAQRFMEITGRQCLEGPKTKLGFDKYNVTCFRCKQKGHFKRECVNREVSENVNPFHADYYKNAIYHHTNEQSPKMNQKQIGEGSSKERKQALVVTQDDEGFNWNKYIPKEKLVLVAEVKSEPVREKTMRERNIACIRLDEMQAAFEEARRAGRWDKKRECYTDPKGNPVVESRSLNFKALLEVIPTSEELYSKKFVDKNYVPNMEKRIR